MRWNKKGLDAYKKEISQDIPRTPLGDRSVRKVETAIKESQPTMSVVESQAKNSGLRRSAELLLMMGSEAAKDALSHMNSDEIAQVMAEVERIRKERRSTVSSPAAESIDGLAAAQGFLKTAFGEREGERILRTAVPELASKPFGFLDELPEDQVVALLKEESIEILAVILPRIRPMLAKRVLETVPVFDQADLVKRIVKVKRVEHEVITRMEEVLKERLRLIGGPIEEEELNGQAALVEILRHMSAEKERTLLEQLANEEPATAKAIEQQLFTIDALHWLTAKDLQMRMQMKDNAELAMLVKGKSDDVRSLILGSLSKRRAEMVLQEEALLGLVPKLEVERVMREFLDELRQEEREGRLILMRPGENFL